MRMELMGEDTPGPGAYLPASTFARAASSSISWKGKPVATTTSSFRSKSQQRVIVKNENLPGVGTYSPVMTAIEKAPSNSAPHLLAKGLRFAQLGNSDWDHETGEVGVKPDPGPGEYETHRFSTMATDAAHAVAYGSRQNPGFGIASPQHQLPHELLINGDLPGPGKYETNTSEISKADGHKSAFKPPTARKMLNNLRPRPDQQKGRSDRRKRRSKSSGKGGDTVHV